MTFETQETFATEETFETPNYEAAETFAAPVMGQSTVAVGPHVKKIGQETVIGFLLGLGTGLAVGVALWFNERNKRMAILEQLELSVKKAEQIGLGNKKMEFNGKEYDLTMEVIKNPATYTKTIMNNISNLKRINKNELDRWQKVSTGIAKMQHAWFLMGVANGTVINKEDPWDGETEVLNKKK